MQSVIKTHYSSSVNRSYPLQLLDIDYTIDRYKNKFLSQPKHERGIFIHYLDLTSWSNIIDSIQNILVNKSSYQIKHLIVNEHPEVNNEFLDFLSQSEIIIQCLNQLEIRKCLLININGIKLINKLTNLQVLDISFYPLIDDEMIKNMFIQLNKLHSINLSNCRLITNDSLSHISELAADRLLNIELANNTLITQVGINKIILKCELLEVLNISKCININFIGIVLNTHGSYQFVSRKIKKLIIDGCIHLHDMSLKWIAIALPDLIEVSMKNIPTITNIIIEGIVRGCFQLKILNCNGCKSITNNSIQYISTIIKNKESESKLNTNLTHLYLAKIHNNIISLDLVDILYYCKALHTIDLSSNSSITDNIFIDLLKLSSSDSIVVYTLHSINISLTSITSYGIACMVQVLTKLEEINISGLKHIDDSALKVIAACCPSIRIIHANDCKGLTDEGIIYLAKYCKYLQVLQLSYTSIVIDMKTTGGETYTQYTDKSIKALFTYAKYLKELSLCNQLNLSFTSHWFKNTLRRVGNYSIQKLDFRGCNSMDEKYLGLFLRFCYALNDVYLPAKFLDTDVSKVKFWY